MAELKYWIWLSTLKGVGNRNMLALLEHFGSPEDIYFAREESLRAVVQGEIEPLLNKSMANAREILRKCQEEGYGILTLHDAAYPTRLKNIYDPPLVLYIRGKMPNLDEEAPIAIVGTRSCTPYGVVSAERMGYEIARSGGLTVTGLARGIDSAAARGALRGGGRVVGVLGCGIDTVYPRENEGLFNDVAATGVILSEYPPGTAPERRNFPARNRIMSGLSLGVLLVEAPLRSGALITASLALEQGRDVFVTPGNIDADSCKGSNSLLKEGAYPAFSGWDVLEQYEAQFPEKLRPPEKGKLRELKGDARDRLVQTETDENRPRKMPRPDPENVRKTTKKVIDKPQDPVYIDILVDLKELSPEERRILEALDGTLHVDEIIEKTGLSASEVSAALTMLEISGAVTQEPGKYFAPHFKFSE